ncbi:unnamed protein product, partial [Meganyctiphanes norvegica]
GEEIEEKGLKCDGPQCVCCTPYKRIIPCSIGKPCGVSLPSAYDGPQESGVYKEKCGVDERVAEYVTPKCLCCTENKCSRASKTCNGGKGLCKRKCGKDEKPIRAIGPDTCGGRPGSCSCCVVQPCKSPSTRCSGTEGRRGKCAEHCRLGTEPIGLCPGPIGMCKCCASKVCMAVGSVCGKTGAGICRESCEIMEIENGKCPGMSCKCCLSPLCLEMNKMCGSKGQGVCKDQCDQRTEQVDGACDGLCCYCCVKK